MVYQSIDLDKLKEQPSRSIPKVPFQHQLEAFGELSKTFKIGGDKPGSGILVLPTGAGKTFTAVRWLCNHVIPKNVKILWLAPSFYLLDQAYSTFCDEAKEIPEPKRTLNIRCISSNPSHAKASSIQPTDDVLIITTPTAISNLYPDAVDICGDQVKTAFRKFIEHCEETGLFVVIDEAHHVPAYGCRNLLVGEESTKLGLRGLLPQSHFLGLTATPTYNDNTRKGWLWKIFDKVIYEADKTKLIHQKILARPNYIEVPTHKELEVDDRLYDRLVRQHKDPPEYIIEALASDRNRNNLIVNTYVSNKEAYGKTIIFADRWFQCVYIKEKLIEKGVKADAIYSHIDADPGSAAARNNRTQDDNKRILEQFKTGKDLHGNDAPLDVLINVRMLTEGADVPSVETVFLTRQTTSTILMTQMIGRALRGEKAGGSNEANIVLFFDDWKGLINDKDWANLPRGETEGGKPIVRGHYPLEYISIHLVEEVAKSIENPGELILPFAKIMPVGWYKTEIVYATFDSTQESMEAAIEFVLVYEHTQSKFEQFLNFLSGFNLDEWSKEKLDDKWMQEQAALWIEEWFAGEDDAIGGRLHSDLIKIVRHIAQNQEEPPYHSFEERDLYDLDKMAEKVIDLPARSCRAQLEHEFSKPGALWKTFFKTFGRFEAAIDAKKREIMNRETCGGGICPPPPPPSTTGGDEPSDDLKRQIKARDGSACLCCGVSGKGVKLQIDHIIPKKFGGGNTLDNLQTLCSVCNSDKDINALNFRFNQTLLPQPKNIDLTLPPRVQDAPRVVTRIVNFFYHCKAVCRINTSDRRNGRYYLVWEICLYSGNNPEWLLSHKEELLGFIQRQLKCPQVQDIDVVSG